MSFFLINPYRFGSSGHYALVSMVSNISAHDYSTPEILSWDEEVYDYGGWYSAGSPTRLTAIATGIVRVSAFVGGSSVGAGNYRVTEILKNGSALSPKVKESVYNVTEYGRGTFSYPISVTAGDYFQVQYTSNDTSTDVIAVKSWFAIETVE